MPIVNVTLWEEVLDEDTETKVIGALTDGLVEVFGEHVRPHVRVVIGAVAQRRSGTGGVPDSVLAGAPAQAQRP